MIATPIVTTSGARGANGAPSAAQPNAARLRFPRTLVLVALLTTCAACGGGGDGDHSRPEPRDGTGPIAAENRKPGSDAWQFWRFGYTPSDDTVEQIKGYASTTSVAHGGAITFYVSVSPPQAYTIDVYRIGWYAGLGGALVTSLGPFDGIRQAECPIDALSGLIACAWLPSETLVVPPSWVTGVYLAVLRNAEGFASFIVFVVRDDERDADIIYQQSVMTYQAYNDYPSDGRRGKNLYGSSFGPPTIANSPRAVAVSFDRPYANDGGGQFLRWEIDFVRWLERSGYDVSYTTDVDTHLDGARLLRSKAFLSVGHDEYWSVEMFDAIEQARDAGVHLGFFGGNDAFWQVRFEASAQNGPARTMVCYKDAALDPVQGNTTTVQWREPPVARPEQLLIGLQFGDIIGGGIDGSYADYVVQNAGHWVYQGTGLRDGDIVPGIVGYETDLRDERVALPAQRNASWTLLSDSPYVNSAGVPSHASSAIYRAPSGAWVFAAGSIGWSLGLDAFGDHAVPDERLERITRNILDRFVQ